MSVSVKKKSEALEYLKTYKGGNTALMMFRNNILNKREEMNDFVCEFVLRNRDLEPKWIGKMVKVCDWFGEKKKEEWNIDFVPQKFKITWYLGETDTTYCCYAQYRKSVEPHMMFIPKKALRTDFLSEDYNLMEIDFEKYNRLMARKDPSRRVMPHQEIGVKFLLSRKKCILADDMGLTKTAQLSMAALEGNFESVLIICPSGLKTNWKRELEWFVDGKDVTIIGSPDTMNKGELEDFLGYEEGTSGRKVEELREEAKKMGKWKSNRFVIVNYDILDELHKIPASRSQESITDALSKSPMLQYLRGKKSLIIIDEAHRLSNTGSMQYKIIRDLIRRANPDSIYEATGTPITNRPMNLYNVLALIGADITLDWEYYVQRYCDGFQIPAKGEKEKWTSIFLKKIGKPSFESLTFEQRGNLKSFIRDNARKIWVNNGESNLDELKDRVSTIYLRRVKEDLPGMVKKTIHEEYYELNPTQRIEYKRLWEEYEKAQMEEDEEKELNKELLEGGLYRRYLAEQMVPKTEVLVDKLISEGRKVVVFCCYDNELYSLQEYYGERCVIFNGKTNAKQKDKAVERFMTDPGCMVFIGNIMAAGVGITLTASHTMVYNSFSFVPGDNFQAADRVARVGQTKDVDIYYQMFRDTYCEHIWNVVLRKHTVIEQVIKKEEEKN